MNDILLWNLELLGKGTLWLMVAVVVSRWRSWRLAVGGICLISVLSLVPAGWTWEGDFSSLEPVGQSLQNPVVTAAPSQPTDPPDQSELSDITWWDAITIAWLVGTLGIGAWLGWGSFVAWRWKKTATSVADQALLAELNAVATLMNCSRVPALATSSRIPGPCVVGALRPVILLPTDFHQWDEVTRGVVLRHEMAHIQRWDGLFSWVRSVLLLFHWPNPLAWLAVAREQREQEMAADRQVLASGVEPASYAALLLKLAQCYPQRQAPAGAVAMAQLSQMEGRFRQILSPAEPQRKRLGAVGKLLALLLAILTGCTAYRSPQRATDALAGPVPDRGSIMLDVLKEQLGRKTPKAGSLVIEFRLLDAKGNPTSVDLGSASSGRKWEVTVPGTVYLNPGQNGNAESTREFLYPTAFAFPEVPKKASPGSFPVTPTTPTAFASRNIGLALQYLTAEPKAAYYLIQGRYMETTSDGFINCPGEAFSPIVTGSEDILGRPVPITLTENRVPQPAFTSRETPFVVSAIPGNTYKVQLNSRKSGCVLEIKCRVP